MKTYGNSVTLFSDNISPPQEKIEYVCILDSILKIEKKYYPQVYLEQCKYKAKERKIKNLIDYELSDPDSDSDEE